LDGTVMKMPLDGTGTPITLVSGLIVRPTGIAVEASFVYWTNVGSLQGPDGGVMKVSLDGGTPMSLVAGRSGVGETIAVNANSVYWAELCTLLSVPLNGGTIVRVGGGSGCFLNDITGIALDAADVYWVPGPYKQPFAGGDPVNFRNGANPGSLAVDASSVYWTEGEFPCDTNPCQPPHTSPVMRASVNGGAGVTLAADQDLPGAIAVDAEHVYWTTAHEVKRTGLDGGAIETLASNQGRPHALVLSATEVYWADVPIDGQPPAIRKIAK
jgi:hypothetical protein